MSAARASAVVIGGGPAGLFAAETLAKAGLAVAVHDRMPSVGRKFLMAGRGGLNLTHSEDHARFVSRYGEAAGWLSPMLDALAPAGLVRWCEELGQETFVGSSGRVFPKAMKASPLLRAWLARLDRLGVRFVTRSRWRGFSPDGGLVMAGEDGDTVLRPDVAVLALGGASWPRLGSDGSWSPVLRSAGVEVAELKPANVGWLLPWSGHFAGRFHGAPLKRIAITQGRRTVRGEAVITRGGLEGGVVYALGASVRDALRDGTAPISLDLRPDLGLDALRQRLEGPRAGASTATILRKRAGLSPEAAGVLREAGPLPTEPEALAARIKDVRLAVTGLSDFDRAISSAGGVRREAVDDALMLKARPGLFVAGEMLDWEAPTGGYLLQASFATGHAAAMGALGWLARAR